MALLQYSTLYTVIIFTAVVITIPVLCGVHVIPVRVRIVYMNEKYLYNYSCVVKRYSRTSPHYINVESTLKKEWNNNVTINLIINEYLHNEYRRSFIGLHYKYCDLLNNANLGASIAAYGIKCPLAVPKNYQRYIRQMQYDKGLPQRFPRSLVLDHPYITGSSAGPPCGRPTLRIPVVFEA
ncbi:unnamed protein product, partial [Brenthis ino]